MITLFLDTSTSKLIVGIYRENSCISLTEENSENNLSSKVLPNIKDILNKCELSIDEIDKILVVNGPGSFTGIRVGVTVAKTLAYTKKISINTVSSLELIGTTEVKTNYIVPLIDARRDYFYASMYDEEGKVIIKEAYISRIDLLNKIKRHASLSNVTFVSYDNILSLDSIKPNSNIESIVKKYRKKETLNPHLVNPNYLKKVEAEEQLDDKRNK